MLGIWEAGALMTTYDPSKDVRDIHRENSLDIIHTFVLREMDLWSLDAWLGKALAIMLKAFLERSEKAIDRPEWHEEMHGVAKDLMLMGSARYYYVDEVTEKAEAAMKKFAEQIGGMWW
jgi:hypothetical protein